MGNFQKLKIEIDGDLVIRKGERILLDSFQLYEIIQLLLQVKQYLPEDWVLETEQDVSKGRFLIYLGARSIENVPREIIGNEKSAPEGLHREGEYFYRNNSSTPGGPESLINEIKAKLDAFGIAAGDYSIYFHRRKGLIEIAFESSTL